MARSEARLAVSIWTDADFLALSPTAQRMFMFLLSQPDLAHDGVLALRERRWSTSAAGMTRTDVERDLEELRRTRFVVVDDDTEEVLIRSFIRRDKVYRQPNVLRAAADHLGVVSSRTILAAVGAELHRILDADDIAAPSADIVRDMISALPKGSPNPSGNPSRNPSDAPPRSDHGAGTDSEGGDVSAGVKGSGNPSGNPSPNPSGNPSVRTPGERGEVTAVRSGSPFPDLRSTDPDPRPQSSTGGRAGVRETPPAGVPAGPPPSRSLINPNEPGTVTSVGHHGLQEGSADVGHQGLREDPADTTGPAPAAGTPRVGAAEPRGTRSPGSGPPPERCADHLYAERPPSCGRCGDARKRRDRYDRDQAAAAARTQSERARQQAAASRAAINACNLCDPTGYRDNRLCPHDPNQDTRVRRGASLAAAAIRRPASPAEGTTQP